MAISERRIHADPIELPLKKAECERAYCYASEEVEAMYEMCNRSLKLRWLQNVIVGLACTGMRIEELCNLKWADITFDKRMLTVADERGFANRTDENRSNKSSQTRHLPIREELLEVLESLPRTDQYIFHGPRGGRLKADTVRNVLVREVITPLTKQFPKQFPNEKSFEDGRLKPSGTSRANLTHDFVPVLSQLTGTRKKDPAKHDVLHGLFDTAEGTGLEPAAPCGVPQFQ